MSKNLQQRYKDTLYAFFERKQKDYPDGFKSNQEAGGFLLNNIISISNEFPESSNQIVHAFIYVYEEDESYSFTDLYSASSEIYGVKTQFEKDVIKNLRENINRYDEFQDKDRRKSVLQWILTEKKSVAIYVKKGEAGHKNSIFFRKVGKRFLRIDDQLIKFGSILEPSYFHFLDFLKKNNLEYPGNYFAIIPIKRLSSIDSKILGLGLFFFKKNFSEKDNQINISIAEFDNMEITLTTISEMSSEYEKELLKERNQILNGMKNLSELYIHSFTQYATRIKENINKNEDGKLCLKNINLEEKLRDIMQVKDEIVNLQEKVLKNLSKIQYNQKIRIKNFIDNFFSFSEVKKVLKKHEITHHIKIDAKKTIRIDKNVLTEIFNVLLDNAKKALQEKNTYKKILINVGIEEIKKQMYLYINFSDNGCGFLSEKDKDKVIKTDGSSYWREKGARGLGMGLYLSRCMLTIFGGEIKIMGVADEGMSTTVQILLPIE
ncbi:MAG: ATP-binding protein [Candidatus Aminicenantes bacterium]|nr:ATP-binding protein [Candidatus Aminicenantes bacterium]